MSDQNLATPKMVTVEQSPKGIIFRESALRYDATQIDATQNTFFPPSSSVCSRFTQSGRRNSN